MYNFEANNINYNNDIMKNNLKTNNIKMKNDCKEHFYGPQPHQLKPALKYKNKKQNCGLNKTTAPTRIQTRKRCLKNDISPNCLTLKNITAVSDKINIGLPKGKVKAKCQLTRRTSRTTNGNLIDDCTATQKVVQHTTITIGYYVGEDVIVKRMDERFYLGTIAVIVADQCLIAFDDHTIYRYKLDDLIEISSDPLSNNPVCIVCEKTGKSCNDDVETCERCGRSYHQKCVERSYQKIGIWYCRRCILLFEFNNYETDEEKLMSYSGIQNCSSAISDKSGRSYNNLLQNYKNNEFTTEDSSIDDSSTSIASSDTNHFFNVYAPIKNEDSLHIYTDFEEDENEKTSFKSDTSFQMADIIAETSTALKKSMSSTSEVVELIKKRDREIKSAFLNEFIQQKHLLKTLFENNRNINSDDIIDLCSDSSSSDESSSHGKLDSRVSPLKLVDHRMHGYSVQQDVFVQHKDGKLYLGTITAITDDNTEYFATPDKLIRISSSVSSSTTEQVCVICKKKGSSSNDFVEVQTDKNWYCRRCVPQKHDYITVPKELRCSGVDVYEEIKEKDENKENYFQSDTLFKRAGILTSTSIAEKKTLSPISELIVTSKKCTRKRKSSRAQQEHLVTTSTDNRSNKYYYDDVGCDLLSNETSSRSALDLKTPPTENFQDKNNPFQLLKLQKGENNSTQKLHKHAVIQPNFVRKLFGENINNNDPSRINNNNAGQFRNVRIIKRQLTAKDFIIGPNNEMKRRRIRRRKLGVIRTTLIPNLIKSASYQLPIRKDSRDWAVLPIGSLTSGSSSTSCTPPVRSLTSGISSTSSTPPIRSLTSGISSTSSTPPIRSLTSRRSSTSSTPPIRSLTSEISSTSNTPPISSLTSVSSSTSSTPQAVSTSKATNLNSLNILANNKARLRLRQEKNYLGAVNRIENFVIRAKRFTKTGKYEYLIERGYD